MSLKKLIQNSPQGHDYKLIKLKVTRNQSMTATNYYANADTSMAKSYKKNVAIENFFATAIFIHIIKKTQS